MKEYFIKAKDGLKLCVYESELREPKALIQIIHGMCEHKKRYAPFIDYLTRNGYVVIMSDNRGHGKSRSDEYVLGNTGSVMDMVSDQVIISNHIKEIHPGLKLFLFAHSMGTLIARAYLMENDSLVDGVILSGAPCPNPMAWLATSLANLKCKTMGYNESSKLLFYFVNNFSMENDLSWLSYNEENIAKYQKDPLCGFYFKNRGYLTLFQMVRLLKKSKKYKCSKSDMPLLLLSGKDDRTTGGEKGVANTVKALNKAGYTNVNHHEFDHMKHEILNEVNHADVEKMALDTYNSWL